MLRIEDTDRERSTPENVDQILDALRWLELDWDEGPLSQAERADRHRARIAELIAADRAYPDTATADDVRAYKQANDNAGYRGEPRPGEGAAIRLRVPDEGETVVEDLIRGPVSFENRLQDDLVIARGDGTPLYNFAVAVDDAEMEITARDPRRRPPLEHAEAAARSRGSRRRSRRATRTCRCCTGPTARSSPSATAPPRSRSCATWATCRLRFATTWRCSAGAPTTTRRSSRPPQLVEQFSIERVGRSSAIFDERKLRWLNGRYMRELPLDDYVRRRPPSSSATGHAEAAADRERSRGPARSPRRRRRPSPSSGR